MHSSRWLQTVLAEDHQPQGSSSASRSSRPRPRDDVPRSYQDSLMKSPTPGPPAMMYPAPNPPILSTAPLLSFYDRVTRKQIFLDSSVAQAARERPELFPECIEGGPSLALEVLRNAQNNSRCPTHTERRMRRYAGPEDVLLCGCPQEKGIMELWLLKTAVQQPGFQDELNRLRALLADIGANLGNTKVNSANTFTSENILFVRAALSAISGLGVDDMFAPEETRILKTAQWSVQKVMAYHGHRSPALNQMAAAFLAELAKAQHPGAGQRSHSSPHSHSQHHSQSYGHPSYSLYSPASGSHSHSSRSS